MACWYSWYLIANSISSKGCSSLFHDWFPKLMYHWKEKLTGNPCVCWVNDLPQIKPVSVCSKSNLRKRIFSSKTPHMGPKFPLNILSNGWFAQKQQQFGWIWWFPGSSSSQILGGAERAARTRHGVYRFLILLYYYRPHAHITHVYRLNLHITSYYLCIQITFTQDFVHAHIVIVHKSIYVIYRNKSHLYKDHICTQIASRYRLHIHCTYRLHLRMYRSHLCTNCKYTNYTTSICSFRPHTDYVICMQIASACI